MGPRLQERGVTNSKKLILSAVRLQWGRAYKSAEFGSIWEPKFYGAKLQWGRAYKSAEFHLAKYYVSWAAYASMGPRLQERGVDTHYP